MDTKSQQASARISQLLDEIMDLIQPTKECDDPHCDGHPETVDGPWLVDGWGLAVDFIAEGDNGEMDTETLIFRSRSLPQSQCIGLGRLMQRWAGG